MTEAREQNYCNTTVSLLESSCPEVVNAACNMKTNEEPYCQEDKRRALLPGRQTKSPIARKTNEEPYGQEDNRRAHCQEDNRRVLLPGRQP